ncbi:MAG: type VI secretion system-associated FHA domain protein TagH, partial [Candidatus Competibacterales bacterium]
AMDVLMARGNFKSIVGVEKTMIRPQSNNPLKLFTPSAGREALKNLLGRSSPAYLPPVEAVREGFDDIRIHHLAVMAGTQAALNQLLDQIDPKQLERQFPKPTFWDRLIPGRTRARHWAAYEDLYDELAEKVKEDFSKALKNFAVAYEEQERSREQGAQQARR